MAKIRFMINMGLRVKFRVIQRNGQRRSCNKNCPLRNYLVHRMFREEEQDGVRLFSHERFHDNSFCQWSVINFLIPRCFRRSFWQNSQTHH